MDDHCSLLWKGSLPSDWGIYFRHAALNSRPTALFPQQHRKLHFISLYVKRNKDKQLLLFKNITQRCRWQWMYSSMYQPPPPPPGGWAPGRCGELSSCTACDDTAVSSTRRHCLLHGPVNRRSPACEMLRLYGTRRLKCRWSLSSAR